MATSGGDASLASHFRSKRRLLGAASLDPESALKQLQEDASKSSEDALVAAFRFDFGEPDVTLVASTSKKKKKKKKKGKKKEKREENEVHDPSADKEVVASNDTADAVQTASASTASKNDVVTAPITDISKPVTAKKPSSRKTPGKKEAEAAPAPTAGFLKLRKASSSDSEVMKMHLRYGRGRRNLAAIAQKEKQKLAQTQTHTADSGGVSAGSSSSTVADASATSFQFNFAA